MRPGRGGRSHCPPAKAECGSNAAGTPSALAAPMRSLIVVVCLLAATGCHGDSPVGPTVPLDQRFTLAPAESAVIEDANLRVSFVEVIGDSRCPVDAVCIQGGDAVVHVRVVDGRRVFHYELHTGDADRATVQHGDFRLELIELRPFPFSSRTIAPDEYRAAFRVVR